MNEITKKYYDELDDLLFYLRHNILQITSGVTEYDDDNLEEVFNENAKLKIKINKAIEYIKQRKLEVAEEELQWVEMKVEEYNTEYNKLLEILGDKESE